MTKDIYLVVSNPYALFSLLGSKRIDYSILGLKDAFFCIPLGKYSQSLFAFEWVDLDGGNSGQIT